jgi:2-polyprenyl-3-methyl-5-hydroxy-6-metoxy-1,4-benzoquinol methylase
MSDSKFPPYELFDEVCRHGLAKVRPLDQDARDGDPFGWNFGSTRPPSYWAFGRMRALFALSVARSLRPKRVLEVAAGDAALCACLAAAGVAEVVANDLRRENLEKSVDGFTNRDRIRIVAGDLFSLKPEEIGQFDLVIACEIVEHVAHTPEFLRQLRKFMTEDGHLLLTTPNGAYFRNDLPTYSEVPDFAALEAHQFKPDADGHLFLITPEEMNQLASLTGLRIEHIDLWASPFLTGEAGFRIASHLLSKRLCYRLETGCQQLPPSLRFRFMKQMSVLMRRRGS